MIILAGSTSAMLVSLLPLVAMFAIMYFLIMRPEKKRKEAYRLMLSQLAVNDEVITKGGIVGKIIRLDDENMVLETGPDRVRVRMMKDAIFTKVNKDVSIKVERS